MKLSSCHYLLVVVAVRDSFCAGGCVCDTRATLLLTSAVLACAYVARFGCTGIMGCGDDAAHQKGFRCAAPYLLDCRGAYSMNYAATIYLWWLSMVPLYPEI